MVPSSVPSTNSCPTSRDLHHPNASQGAVVINDKSSKLPTKKATRAGALNYSNDDISAMLDIVEQEEPLGANHWAVVASNFTKWARENARPHRDQDSLKNKFDKLSNMKKKTGDPSCPQPFKRAKHIARAIHNKCAAMTLGGSSDGEYNAVVVPIVLKEVREALVAMELVNRGRKGKQQRQVQYLKQRRACFSGLSCCYKRAFCSDFRLYRSALFGRYNQE